MQSEQQLGARHNTGGLPKSCAGAQIHHSVARRSCACAQIHHSGARRAHTCQRMQNCDEAATNSRLARGITATTDTSLNCGGPFSKSGSVTTTICEGHVLGEEYSYVRYAADTLWISTPVVYTTGGPDSAKRATTGRAPYYWSAQKSRRHANPS